MSGKSGCSVSYLSACALGIALGITWSLGIVIMGIMSWQFHYAEALVTAFGSLYWGYAGTPIGISFGAVWGFLDGFIGGVVIAWIYNFVTKHCFCKSCHTSSKEDKKE